MTSRVTQALVTFAIGAALGGVVCFVLVETPPWALIVASAALGAVLASALRTAVEGPLR